MEYNVRYTNLSFGKAFDIIRMNTEFLGMRLKSWKPDVVVRIQMPDYTSKMTAPYLYVESRYGRVPWKETMIELFSKEWEVVEIVKINKYDFKKDTNNVNWSLNNKIDTKNTNNIKTEYNNCSDECKKRCLNECDKLKYKFTHNNDKKNDKTDLDLFNSYINFIYDLFGDLYK